MKLKFTVSIENDVTQDEFRRVCAAMGMSVIKYMSFCEAEVQRRIQVGRMGNKETIIVTGGKLEFDEERVQKAAEVEETRK